MVLYKHAEFLYKNIEELITVHLKEITDKVASANQQQFLHVLQEEWNAHKVAMSMIKDILMYMDRNYLDRMKRPTLYSVGMNLFCEHVAKEQRIQPKLIAMLLDMVQRERTGEVIERSVIKSAVKMLCELGQHVYQEHFESKFLQASTEFYKAESLQYISHVSCPEYLQRADQRLTEESERVNHYLDSKTESKIRKVVETAMLANHLRTLIDMESSGLIFMLTNDRLSDLQRMYRMFSKVDGALQAMKDTMCAHIKKIGTQIVNDEEKNKDPVAFVDSLLELRSKFDRVIRESFNSDKGFQNALNHTFEQFINENQRSPEYLSLFLDQTLRSELKGSNDNEIDTTIENVLILFRYVQDKDIFERYYKNHLAKRLLGKRSVSEDAERLVLTKLKQECGNQFTAKLESMFNDMKVSADIMKEYKDYLSNNGVTLPIDLSVTVLTTGCWPTSSLPGCDVPEACEKACESFKKFYLGRHSGRKLTWQTNMGTADVKGFFGGGALKYEITCSTYQMAILLLFNQQESWTYKEIAETTKIPSNELKRNLQSLACAKFRVINKEPKGKDVNESDAFSFNDSFTSKLVRFKIMTVAATKETETEKTETRAKVDDDRKPQIEAAIVRIMKSRKVVDHNILISEVTQQLASRFVPSPAVIKKRIENLIEREYLKRDENDPKKYNYLA
eukprot:TRINITY_DN1427_c0_g1::TRINITY_DN1427_c0_g1_i1::g.27310::m.27310 TRINITY_DN1427_c0_g1::TRINITY_DN1427_c0_g1_i1::g.27310  ORF type:complete len:751 (+),score=125.08,sp/Q9ZVH4/CUL3A_ARATH/51.70/0.0,Cullin/PF00888.17/7.9e-181,Cullin_Nedd8/PF10557.4/9.5e+02,Cullin_Nedd8/PF10557.4/1.3e-29,TrmB/PF01978.14/0.89,TrmB/PF01978.14/43,DUF739/PF05339.6/7.3e+02,DUF739/PF05339.6/0.22,DUF739/PF05339.6/5.8e+02,HTH_20/PF12840.2/9.4e+03,HTH_20/PF12840.2/0.11,Rrf2/PF02082.15/2.1e+03,Rrf2/PF02082.15/2.3e+03,Rrf2/PF02